MPPRRNASRRPPPALALVACAALGCYQSWSDEDADVREDARADGSEDVAADDARADRTEDADAEDAPGEDFGPDDAGPEAEVSPACPPEPGDGSWLSFSVDDDPYEPVDLAVSCEVAEVVSSSPDTTSLVLVCDDPAGLPLHAITIRANPHPPLGFLAGRRVRFRHVAQLGFEWAERHFRLTDEDSGAALLAGVDATTTSPRGIPAADWYRPYHVDVVAGVCPVLPDPCGTRERLALDVAFDRDVMRLFDGYQGTVGVVGRLWAFVGGAWRYDEMTCVDLVNEHYLALFALLEDG